MAEEQFKITARRLGVVDIAVIRKAEELHRLIEMKTKYINSSVKIILSIECAATILGQPYEKEDAQKLTSLNGKEYKRQMEMFKKLLNINKQVSVRDFCLRLELTSSVQETANQLLKAYKTQLHFDEDVNETRYVTMAVCLAAKFHNIKGNKVRREMKSQSGLNSAQWETLEERWTSWMERTKPLDNKKKVVQSSFAPEESTQEGKTTEVKRNVVKSVPYEVWKKDILKRAHALIRIREESDKSSPDL